MQARPWHWARIVSVCSLSLTASFTAHKLDYAGICSHQGVNNLSHASSMTMRVALPIGSIRCTVKRVSRSPVRLSLCTCGLRLASQVLLAPVRNLMRTGWGRA
jgi:ribosomal protein L28